MNASVTGNTPGATNAGAGRRTGASFLPQFVKFSSDPDMKTTFLAASRRPETTKTAQIQTHGSIDRSIPW
jgi:hypothetical protein